MLIKTLIFPSLPPIPLSLSVSLSFPLSAIHLKMDCSVTWTNTSLRAAINTFRQKLHTVPDVSSITICIKQRAFYMTASQGAVARGSRGCRR